MMTETDVTIRDLLAQAEQAMQDNRWDRAMELVGEVLKLQDHPLAARIRRDATEKKARDAEICELIASADDLCQQGQYPRAIEMYDRAQAVGARANVLGHHAEIERKRTAARERQGWRGRLDEALHQVDRHTRGKEWPKALEALDPLLEGLRATAYDDLLKEADQARRQVLGQLDMQELLEQAQEAFDGQDFEAAIELAERVLERVAEVAGDGLIERVKKELDPVKKGAERIARESRRILETFVRPTAEAAETAFRNDRLDDAAALLFRLRSQFPNNPTWQRMWLTVYMDHGRQQLDVGRQVNVHRRFKEAVRAFAEAREAFTRVLEVYPEHPSAGDLRSQADELRQTAIWEDQAHVDWDAGRRQDARGALQKARDQLDDAAAAGKDYSTVSATVDAMLVALDDEIERAREEKRCVLRAEQLLGDRRLDEAAERFHQALDALEPETASDAREGYHRVETEREAFQASIDRARTATDPAAKVEAYQAAYDCWPTGPEMPDVLVDTLARAAQTALHAGLQEGAIALANRALSLDPDNRQARDVLNRVEKGPAVRTILEEIGKNLLDVEREAEPTPEHYEPLLLRLRHAQDLAEAMSDLNGLVEDALKDVRRRQERLQEYRAPAAQAETLRRAGDWEGAVKALEQALEALGDLPLAAPRNRLVAWRRVTARLSEAKKTAQGAFAEAQKAYEATGKAEGEGRYDFAAPLAHLGQALAALKAAREATEGFLPPDVVALEHQVADLRSRAEVAQQAWELSSENLLEAVKRLRTATQMRQGDPVLEALKETIETQLEEQSEKAAAEYQSQAKVALDQGDVNAAVELLRQALELRDTPEIRGEFTHLQRMAVREARLRDLELDYGSKLQTDSKPDALRSLGEILRLLIGPEAELAQDVRRAANELLQLEKRLDGPDAWERAQELLKQIGDVGLENSTATRLYAYANRWLELGRYVRLEGIISSSADLGNLEEAYRAAQVAIKENPRDQELVQRLADVRGLLVNSLDQSARKRLGRAQELLAQGSYATALENLTEIEDKYGEAESEFEGLLRDHDEAVKIREEARDLCDQATRLQAIAERVAPLVASAREAYAQKRMAEAEELLNRIEIEDPRGEALILKVEADGLRQKVQDLYAEQASRDLEDVLSRAETQLLLAEGEADFEAVIDLLSSVSPRGLTATQRARHQAAVKEAGSVLRAVREGRQWQAEGEKAFKKGDYGTAVRALERALQVAREERVAIETMLGEAAQKWEEKQKQNELLEAGNKSLAAGEYLKAQQELSAARAIGADVAQYLPAARAGVLLNHGWDSLQTGKYSMAERDLGEAILLGQDLECAAEIVDEARRMLNRLQDERKRQGILQALLTDARLLLQGRKFDEAEAKAHQILAQDATHREAYGLLAEIEDRRQAQAARMEKEGEAERLFAQAQAAFDEGNYNKADALVTAILKSLPDYLPATALAQHIATEREAGEALARAEGFAHVGDFASAEASLQEAIRFNPGHGRLGEVQQILRKERREWEEEALQPIRNAYRESKYPDALAACRQALKRGGTPEFQSQVESLQQDIVNRWTEVRLDEARELLQRADTVEAYSIAAAKAREAKDIQPQPSERLLREAERIWREATEARLRSRLTEALRQSDKGDHKASLKTIDEVEREATEFGLGHISFETTQTRWKVDEALGYSYEKELTEQLEKVTVSRRKKTLADLKEALRLAEQATSLPAATDNAAVPELVQGIRAELDLYNATEKALEEADRHLRGHRFRHANSELARLSDVSPLLQDKHSKLQSVTRLLSGAEKAQDELEWTMALDYYAEALALDSTLASMLDGDLSRCRGQLWQGIQDQARMLLNAASPKPQEAIAHLDEAEAKGWVPELERKAWSRLREEAESLVHMASAIRLLDEGKPPSDALCSLSEARKLAPHAKIHPSLPHWEHLARCLDALQAGDLQVARRELNAVEPPVADTRLARLLQERLSAAERTEQAVQVAMREIQGALTSSPPQYDKAVSVAHELRYSLVLQDSRAVKIYDDLRSRLLVELDTLEEGGHFDRAEEICEQLLRLASEDEQIQLRARELPEKRRQRREAALRQANTCLEQDALDEARTAIEEAVTVAGEKGDVRLGELREAVKNRAAELQRVDQAVKDARGRLGQNDLPKAVELALEAHGSAPNYRGVLDLVEKIISRIEARAEALMREERFDPAVEQCDLALRLGPNRAISELRRQILDGKDHVIREAMALADQAREAYDLDTAERSITRGLSIVPGHADLLQRQAALDKLRLYVNTVSSAMEKGWERLKAKAFDDALRSFGEVTRTAPDFGEGWRWLAYADNMVSGIQLVTQEQFAPATKRFEAAKSQLLLYPDEQLTPLLGGMARLVGERRQAAFDAHRLAREAREMAATRKRADGLEQQRKYREASVLLEELMKRVADFEQFVATSESPPEEFTIETSGVRPPSATPDATHSERGRRVSEPSLVPLTDDDQGIDVTQPDDGRPLPGGLPPLLKDERPASESDRQLWDMDQAVSETGDMDEMKRDDHEQDQTKHGEEQDTAIGEAWGAPSDNGSKAGETSAWKDAMPAEKDGLWQGSGLDVPEAPEEKARTGEHVPPTTVPPERELPLEQQVVASSDAQPSQGVEQPAEAGGQDAYGDGQAPEPEPEETSPVLGYEGLMAGFGQSFGFVADEGESEEDHD